VEESNAFDEALDEAGVEHEVVVYPGAPHSFFDRKHEEFADASEDAWNRVLAFLERYRG
jgi:carboxymethylenebutenolidase